MTAQEYFEIAFVLYENKEYNESLEYIEKALLLEPNNPNFLAFNGKTLKKTNKLDEAIYAYKRAIELNFEHAQIYYNLGRIYYDKSLLDEAIVAFEKSIELDPEDGFTYYSLSLAYMDKGEVNKAIASYKKIIKLNPEDDNAYYNLGVVFMGIDELDEAITYFLKAIELNPENGLSYNNLGLVYKDKGKLEDAIIAFQKAIQLSTNDSGAYYNLGLAFYLRSRLDEAIVYFLKAVEVNSENDIAYYNLGIAYMEKQQLDEAITYFLKAIEIDPENNDTYFNLGLAYINKNKFDEAIIFFRKTIELNPKRDDAYYHLGLAYTNKNKLDKAIVFYQKAIELNPQNANAFNNLGLNYMNRNELNEAIVAFKKVVEINPNDSKVYNNLGIAYVNKGKLEEAIVAFQKAIKLSPLEARGFNNLGLAYIDTYKWPESFRKQLAQRHFFRALILQVHHNILRSYLFIWHEYPKHFFFLQDIFSKSIPSESRELYIQEQIADKCRHINLSLLYFESLEANVKVNSLEWAQFIAMINYFMGHPQKAFHIFRDEILSKPPTNLQAHYYLIQSCYDFLEDEKSYLEQALSIAEQIRKTLPKTRRKGILGMGRTKVIIPSKAEVLQRYYAALLFKDNDDIDSALECIAPIWDKTDYLPLVYLYYGLLYEQAEEQQESISSEINDGYNGQTTLRILIKAPFPKIGRRILELETSNDREKHFAYGFPLHAIDPDREKWWEPFYHYAHYREIASYISLWKLQVEHHFNKRKLGIVAGDNLKEFWDCFTIEDIDIIKMQEQIQKYSREKTGLLFLEGAKRYLKEISSQINTDPAQLQGAVEYVLFESGKTKEQSKRAYEELQKMPGKTDNALVYRIASKIEANELGDDLATYYYLNSYFFLSKNLSEKDYIMLNMYATYAQAYQNQGVSKILQGGLKDQFKDMFGTAYDIATVAAANPVLSLTLGALKPLAKGSMGELFIGMIKDIKFTTMMRYADTTYAEPPYEKQVAAPSFQEAFLEFVGKEKERLGGRFEDVYPMYGFEEWIET